MDAGNEPEGLLAEPDRHDSARERWRAARASLDGVRVTLTRWLTPRRRQIAAWGLMLAVLFWLQGDAALASLKYTLQPHRLNGDAQQQIFPFFRYLEPNAFGSDYIADYYLSSYPLGYKGVYLVGSWLGVDPAALSRSLPHLLWLCTVLALGAAAYELGGTLGAFCAMALALGSNLYLARIQGGLPRSFGFPIIALTLAGLAHARVGLCAAGVWLGALFYPVAGVISGLSLGALLLLPERTGFSLSGYSWRRRLLTLAGTAFVALALLAPTALGSGRFGKIVRPDDIAAYPEAGPGGRYSSESRAPFPSFFASVPRAADAALLGAQEPWSPRARAWLLGKHEEARRWSSGNYRQTLWGLALLALAGTIALLVREPAARRVALMGVAAGVGHNAARLLAPYAYLPERYVAYAVPLLGTLALTTCVAGFFGASFAAGWRRWVRLTVVGGYVAALLCLFAGRVSGNVGLTVNLRHDQRLLDTIAELPQGSVVAGWPKGIMNAVSYASRRPTLLTHEVHQAFHAGYVEEMRRRMYALIEAYFATTPEPILRLTREFGVTHLLIERSHFGRRPPGYFRPFGGAIKEARAAGHKRYLLPRIATKAAIFSRGDYVLLDLSKVGEASASAGH